MISILLPTRNRTEELIQMVKSAREKASVFPEIVVYVDEDDNGSAEVAQTLPVTVIIGPKLVFSDYWNKCYEKATGDILMMAADDLLFKTKDWDAVVEDAFSKYPDHIVLIHGNDTHNEHQIPSYPLLHRRWVEVVGYFSPPYFTSGGCDVWLNAVAKFINRRQGVNFFLEQQTNKLQHDVVISPSEQYVSLFDERLCDAAKLKEEIDN